MDDHLENETKIKRSILWKLFFCFFVPLIIWGLYINLNDEKSGLIEIIDIPVYFIGAFGLFGYVFSKRIYKQSFWFGFFWIFLVYTLFAPFLSEIEFLTIDPELSDTANKLINIFAIGAALLTLLPAYIGLLLYGLPSNKLWKIKSN